MRYYIAANKDQAQAVTLYWTQHRTWSWNESDRALMDYRDALREAEGLAARKCVHPFHIYVEE